MHWIFFAHLAEDEVDDGALDVVRDVRDQLSASASAEQTDAGTALTIGPLSVLVSTGERGRGTFLLAGTVTPQTLADAATELAEGVQLQ